MTPEHHIADDRLKLACPWFIHNDVQTMFLHVFSVKWYIKHFKTKLNECIDFLMRAQIFNNKYNCFAQILQKVCQQNVSIFKK